MSPATVAIVRDLTRSDDAVWRAASERFDRDVAQLSSSCAAPSPSPPHQKRPAGKKKGVGPRQLAAAPGVALAPAPQRHDGPIGTPSPRPSRPDASPPYTPSLRREASEASAFDDGPQSTPTGLLAALRRRVGVLRLSAAGGVRE